MKNEIPYELCGDQAKPPVKDEGFEQELKKAVEDAFEGNGLHIRITNVAFSNAVVSVRAILEATTASPRKLLSLLTEIKDYFKAKFGSVRLTYGVERSKEQPRVEANDSPDGLPYEKKDSVFYVEVPNVNRTNVSLRDVLESSSDESERVGKLTFALGKDVQNNSIVKDFTVEPNVAVLGGAGAGKTTFLCSTIVGLIHDRSPRELKLLLIDSKEHSAFNLFDGLPHLIGGRFVADAGNASNALSWLKSEIDSRYEKFAKAMVRNVDEFNEYVSGAGASVMQKIVVVIDDADELFGKNKEAQSQLFACIQKARAAGVHFIVSFSNRSQLLKYFDTRVVFTVASGEASRTALGSDGAEELTGRGDCIYYKDYIEARIQTPQISEEIIRAVTEYSQRKYEQTEDDGFHAEIKSNGNK